jgi:hypothetical protein
MPRFSLRTLLIWLTFAPFLLALAHWTAVWFLGQRIHPTLWTILVASYCLSSIAGPFLLYRELICLICGPEAFVPLPRKTRRHVRYRIERCAGSSS